MLKRTMLVFLPLLLALSCNAQQVVQVGKGSYASTPPPEAGAKARDMQSQELFLLKEDGRPIPTNKWWTQLVVSRFARSLWTYPFRVDTSERGLEVYFPIRWDAEGRDPQCDFPLAVGGKEFKLDAARAKDWSDWMVAFRMTETADRYIDVTLGEGMPCAWLEYHGVQPEMNMPGGADTAFFDRSGQPVTLPSTADCIGISYKNRQYGIFAPDGSKFQQDGARITVEFPAANGYLVVAALPSIKHLDVFHRYAFAVPRDTRLTWKYDPAEGQVTTTWKITTDALKGENHQVIQGWLPHHYRGTTNNFEFHSIDYLSPRGKMRCSVGNEFTITYPYSGIVPNLPAPQKIGGPDDYDSSRMKTYLQELAAEPKFGADTYWGGKDILRFGQCALMAQQIHDSNYATFLDSLKKAMADWFTYTPEKKDHFFTYYPRWKSLVGINTSYGSEGFNDHHFHYGYFTFASALLAMHDAQFAAEYGGMASLVAKDYANWDRNDKRFPFLRTFDPWAGHSWAGGTSSPGGNNQESSSEAVQSWAGLIFLGQALDNSEMRDAGIMGYAMESVAAMDYWFNATGDAFPPEYKHPVTGMVWGGGKVYGTYFTGDPAWIYGIQWLPASPMLSYLVRDPAFARKSYQNMVQDYEVHEAEDAAKAPRDGRPPRAARKATIEDFGASLGSVMLGYRLMYDPQWAAGELDRLWNTPGDIVAHNAGEMAVIYYQAQSMRSLGLVDWTCHGSNPTSMVYLNGDKKTRTYIVWNPSVKPQTVTFYESGKPIGHLLAPGQSLTSSHTVRN